MKRDLGISDLNILILFFFKYLIVNKFYLLLTNKNYYYKFLINTIPCYFL